MLRSHPWIVEARRNRVRLDDLPALVLEQVGPRAVEDARDSSCEGGRMPCVAAPVRLRWACLTACLHSNDFHGLVVEECLEHSDGIRAAAHARHHAIGKPAWAV